MPLHPQPQYFKLSSTTPALQIALEWPELIRSAVKCSEKLVGNRIEMRGVYSKFTKQRSFMPQLIWNLVGCDDPFIDAWALGMPKTRPAHHAQPFRSIPMKLWRMWKPYGIWIPWLSLNFRPWSTPNGPQIAETGTKAASWWRPVPLSCELKDSKTLGLRNSWVS